MRILGNAADPCRFDAQGLAMCTEETYDPHWDGFRGVWGFSSESLKCSVMNKMVQFRTVQELSGAQQEESGRFNVFGCFRFVQVLCLCRFVFLL